MNRATVKAAFDPNKLYASQLLSVVLQTSDNAKAKLVEKKDGIDFLLRVNKLFIIIGKSLVLGPGKLQTTRS